MFLRSIPLQNKTGKAGRKGAVQMVKMQDMFESMPAGRAIATLALPAILSQLVTMVYNLADIFFVGQLGDPNMVAAVSLGFPAFMTLTVLANLFGIGGGSLISRMLGAKKYHDAKRAASFSFWGSVSMALVLAFFVLVFMDPLLSLLGASEATSGFGREYLFWVVVMGSVPTASGLVLGHLLRSEGESKQASMGMALGGVLNILLDPLFIFVFGLGVAGAAMATMISNAAVLSYYLAVMRRLGQNTVLSVSTGDMSLDRGIVRPVFAVGMPAALQLLLAVVSNGTINNLASGYGDIPVAAIGIVKKVDMIPMKFSRGLCQGVLPLVAYNYASKDYTRMETVSRYARIIAAVFAFSCIAAFQLFAPYIMWGFIRNEETIRLGTDFLRIACLATPFMGINALMTTTFQAMGKGKESLILAVCRQGLVNIPLLFVMNRFFGLYGIVWTQLVADLVSLAIALFLYRGVIRQLRSEEAAAGFVT